MLDRTFRTCIIALCAVAVLGAAPASAGSRNQVGAVAIDTEREVTTIRVRGTETPTFTVYKLERPTRIVVDLAAAELAGALGGDDAAATYSVGAWAVGQVQAMALEDGSATVRVVATMARPGRYDVKADGKDVVIKIVARDPAPATASAADLAAAQRETAAAKREVEAAKAAAAKAQAAAEAAQATARAEAQRAAQAQAAADAAAHAAASAGQADRSKAAQELAAAQAEAARAKAAAAAAATAAVRAQDQARATQVAADAELARARAVSAAAAQDADRIRASAQGDAARTRAEAEAQVAAAKQQIERERAAASAAKAEAERLLAAARAEQARVDAAARTASEREAAARSAQLAADARQRAAVDAASVAQRERTAAEAAMRAAAEQKSNAAGASGDAQKARAQADAAMKAAQARLASADQAQRDADAAVAAARRESAAARAAVDGAQAARTAAEAATAKAVKDRAAAEQRATEMIAAADRADARRRAAEQAAATATAAAQDAVAARTSAQADAARAAAEAAAARTRAAQTIADARAAREAEERAAAAAKDAAARTVADAEAKRAADEAAAAAARAAAARTVAEARAARAAEEAAAAAAAKAASAARADADRAVAEARARREAEERALAESRAAREAEERATAAAAAARVEAEKQRAAAERALAELKQSQAAQDRAAAAAAAQAQAAATARAAAAAQSKTATTAERARAEAEVRRLTAAAAAAEAALAASKRDVAARQQEVAALDAARTSTAADLARQQAAADAARAAREREEARLVTAKQAREAEEATLAKLRAEAAKVRATPAGAPTPIAPAASRITAVSFAPDANDHVVTIALDGAGATAELVRADSKRAELVVRGATLPANLTRTLDASRFGGPIRTVSSYTDRATGEVRVVVALAKDAVPRLDTTAGKVQLRFAAAPQISSQRVPSPVVGGFGATSVPVTQTSVAQLGKRRSFRGPTIDLDFKDADIHDLLRALARVGNVSMIVPDEIRASVTVQLKRVPWEQALEVILASKGLWYRKDGTLYRIGDRKVLDAEDEAEAARRKALVELEAPRPDVFTLNYANADDLATKLAPLLSPKGKIEVDKRTNSLIVNDVKANRNDVIDLARRLDTQTPQITIEARVVEARSNFKREFGIQWGGRANASAAGGNATGLVFPSSLGFVGGADDETSKPAAGLATPTDFAVNLPATSNGALGMTLGSVGGNVNINLRLSAMEDTGTARIISAPKVTVLNNVEATMKQGVRIPISQVSAQGTQTTFVEANLELKVTPYVSQRDCAVVMDVSVIKAEPNFARLGARGDPTIDSKEASSRILVNDGETTVMGGIYTRNTSLTYSKIPVLGDLPVLGWLFKSRKEADDRAELLIFITPKITNKASLRCQQ